jgi:hypothetical protein
MLAQAGDLGELTCGGAIWITVGITEGVTVDITERG